MISTLKHSEANDDRYQHSPTEAIEIVAVEQDSVKQDSKAHIEARVEVHPEARAEAHAESCTRAHTPVHTAPSNSIDPINPIDPIDHLEPTDYREPGTPMPQRATQRLVKPVMTKPIMQPVATQPVTTQPVTMQPVTMQPIAVKTTATGPDWYKDDPLQISEGFDRGRLIILIDGSNLFYAASQLGVEINYLKLLHYLVRGGRLVRALFYTGVDPQNDKQQGFLHWLGRNGFRVISKETIQFADGSKKANLDVEIAVDMIRLAPCCDTIVLVSGDGDFIYAVKSLIHQGVRVEVVGLRSMTSSGLINAADYYIDLDAIKPKIQKLEG